MSVNSPILICSGANPDRILQLKQLWDERECISKDGWHTCIVFLYGTIDNSSYSVRESSLHCRAEEDLSTLVSGSGNMSGDMYILPV